MKNFLFLTTFLVTQLAASQTKFNFLVGTTVSSLSEDLMVDYAFDQFRQAYIDAGGSVTSDITNSVRLGIYFSVEADFPIGDKSFAKTGLKYTTTGDSYFFKTDDVVLQSSSGSESDEKFKLRPKLDYISVPVNYGFNISERLSFYAGATPSFNINNVLRNNRFEADGDDVKQKWDSNDNVVEEASLVLFLDAGMSYYLSDLPLVFDLRYNTSINSVYDDPAFDGTTAKFNDSKIWSIELGIGFVVN